MKLQFVGAGSAFNYKDGQSNVLVHADSGKKLLIDCGTMCWGFMNKLDLGVNDIDALYVTHLHADHIGGIEELAFCTYFNPTIDRPKLYANSNVMPELWEQCLRGGLESIQGKVVTLTEYFDCHPVPNNDSFSWEGITFTPVQSVHIMAGYYIKYSYGLMIREIKMTRDEDTITVDDPMVFFTADTQFCPKQIQDFYNAADLIFQDCETAPYYSGVHAHYDDLKGLDDETKKKMCLYHYQPDPEQKPEEDGFMGFAQAGEVFEI